MNSKLFFGGMPTEPQVKKLMEAFPQIEPDQEIPYAEVERIIGATRNEARFRTVTKAWRRAVYRLKNWKLKAQAGVFRRLTERDRSRTDAEEWASGARKAVRAVRDLHRVDTAALDEGERQAHTHRTRVLTANVEHMHAASKELAPPRPPMTLPRLMIQK